MTSRSIVKRNVPDAVSAEVLAGADRCYYCADVLLPRQVEHVRPLSRGGTNDRSNLVAACIACNSQKRGMLVHEWRQWREANGMSWPPVASHPTEFRHFGSRCRPCFDGHASQPSSGGTPSHWFVCSPYALTVVWRGEDSRYRCDYRCPVGHYWQMWTALDRGYFSDCTCRWCAAKRLENGDETWPAPPRYERVESSTA